MTTLSLSGKQIVEGGGTSMTALSRKQIVEGGGTSMTALSLSREQIHTGSLILVNSRYPCRQQPGMVLVPACENAAAASRNTAYENAPAASGNTACENAAAILLERRAAVLLNSLMESIHGWRQIVPVSGWRSQGEQQKIWDDSLQENGRIFTETYVALPGHSEHQTGLAIDLGLQQEHIDFIRPEFPYTGICQTFRRRASGFGFVERYPKDKEHVTGIGHEPWHFRYVGVPHAAVMEQLRLTLEEYTDFLRQFPYGERPYQYRQGGLAVNISYLKSTGDVTFAQLDGGHPYSVSGNNVDGFIITEWRGAYARENCLRRA